ncbi:DUF2934 domain-containing protein [Rhodopseudomonas pseudopalustris]|uniref:Uncharacterized protein n=1 Tax=Rhodopseudomonas pseudopalustris TaxID=1513892 RepID=A0A1H8XDS3_9BRAD|nr:DUF2934 domain-containing protein [Rhodopseudomonas pseudopalustris]SEP38164.1 hypothetical protein SAMN05444123_1234 [Rhodopseudomonas pseudopalustris]
MKDQLEERIDHRTEEMRQVKGLPEERRGEFRKQAEKDVKGEKETYEQLKSDPSITTNT